MLLRGRTVNNLELGRTVTLIMMLDHDMLLGPDVIRKSHHLKDCKARLTACQSLADAPAIDTLSIQDPPNPVLSVKCSSGGLSEA